MIGRALSPGMVRHGPDPGWIRPIQISRSARPAWFPWCHKQEVERILAENVARIGVPVLRGVEINPGLSQDDTGVTVELPANGESVRCGWLVRLRRRPQHGPQDRRLRIPRHRPHDQPATRRSWRSPTRKKLRIGWHRTPVGMVVYGPVPGRILTVEYEGPPPDRDHPGDTGPSCRPALRNVSGTDVTLTGVVSATRVHRQRPPGHPRTGWAGCLLAGDAGARALAVRRPRA